MNFTYIAYETAKMFSPDAKTVQKYQRAQYGLADVQPIPSQPSCIVLIREGTSLESGIPMMGNIFDGDYRIDKIPTFRLEYDMIEIQYDPQTQYVKFMKYYHDLSYFQQLSVMVPGGYNTLVIFSYNNLRQVISIGDSTQVQIKFPFLFSYANRHSDLVIQSQRQIVVTMQLDQQYYYIGQIWPSINQSENNVTLNFQISNLPNGEVLGVGVCNQEIMFDNNHSFYHVSPLGSGTYLLFSNVFFWHNSSSLYNNKKISSTYEQGNVISVTFTKQNQSIQFFKDKIFFLTLPMNERVKNLNFCVAMHSMQSTINLQLNILINLHIIIFKRWHLSFFQLILHLLQTNKIITLFQGNKYLTISILIQIKFQRLNYIYNYTWMGCGVSQPQISVPYHHQSSNTTIQLTPTKFNPENITENIKILSKIKCFEDVENISQVLKNHFIFYSLNQQIIENIIQRMFYCVFRKKTQLYDGETPSCFFIIEQGQLQSNQQNFTTNQTLGEMALLQYGTTKEIIALDDTYMWGLDRNAFISSLDLIMDNQYDNNLSIIQQQKFLQFMTPMQQDALAHKVFIAKYLPQQTIVNEGDRADSFFIILSGQASVFKGQRLQKLLTVKDSFGQQSLIFHQKRKSSVRAVTEVKCLILKRDKIKTVLGQDVKMALQQNIIRYALNKLRVFNSVQVEKLIYYFKVKVCQDEIIYDKCEMDKIIIVLEGQLFSDQGYSLKQGQTLYSKQKLKCNELWKCNGAIAYIQNQQILDILSNHNQLQQQYTIIINNKIEIQLQDLNQKELIAKSTYGNVYKFKYQENEYVIKQIDKKYIQQQNLDKQLKQEIKVLEVKNPFICNLVASLEDKNNIFHIHEYAQGQLLSDFLHEHGLLNKDTSQVILGQILLLLERFHKSNIISRDIKPDNFIISEQGTIKYIDYKYCKISQKTYTLVGTPHYMAPEIINGKGYNCLSDIWSLGVCLFEFLCGGVPYGENVDDAYSIYEEIQQAKIQFPTFLQDFQAINLIKQLLNQEPYQRVGASFSQLKSHPWFTIDWYQMIQFKQNEVKPKVRELRRSVNKEFWDS
ncbi:hypothetical protein pb186bvf_020766 [Paramecium bursaria]